jgi:uncharacterized membrane protein AbrB (regulator of aidB expression)
MLVLLGLTAALVAVLYVSGIPAAFLLGALGAAMMVAGRGGVVRLPDWIFSLAQAVVGCLIARSFTPALFAAVRQHFALFAGVTFSVLLSRRRLASCSRGFGCFRGARRFGEPSRAPRRPWCSSPAPSGATCAWSP